MDVDILKLTSLLFLFFLISSEVSASLNINVKIGQMIGNRLVEINKNIQAEFDKEIIITTENFKNKIVLNLRKFNYPLVDGLKINPIQIDMKLVNEMQQMIGRPHTITSFYNHSAHFSIPSSGIITDVADLNVSLNFEEKN